MQIWCAFFALTIAVVALCVRYVDRPICLFADSLFGQFASIGDFKRTPNFFDPLALLLFALFLLRRLVRRPIGKLDVVCILGDASLLFTRYISDKLKYVFARTYPKYGSPSLIHDGAYSFNFFRPGHDYLSFPSGHTAALCCLLSILWIFYPRFRTLYALTAIGFSAVLVATNYHFLSDTIAGDLSAHRAARLLFLRGAAYLRVPCCESRLSKAFRSIRSGMSRSKRMHRRTVLRRLPLGTSDVLRRRSRGE